MIYTVTLNPAIDYYISMNEFNEGELNSIENGYTLPGGKGINVSKVLKNFGVESTALGFAGGFTGDYIRKNLREYGITEELVELKENTRINIKMKTDKDESEIAGHSPKISSEECEKFLDTMKKIKSEDILVLSGSVPKSLDSRIYERIIEMLPEGVKVILDTRGEPFEFALKKGVFLTKPNNVELGEFFGEKYETTEEIIAAGEKLRKMGSKNVIIPNLYASSNSFPSISPYVIPATIESPAPTELISFPLGAFPLYTPFSFISIDPSLPIEIIIFLLPIALNFFPASTISSVVSNFLWKNSDNSSIFGFVINTPLSNAFVNGSPLVSNITFVPSGNFSIISP